MKRILFLIELGMVSANFFLVYFLLEAYSLNLFAGSEFIKGLHPLHMYAPTFLLSTAIWGFLLFFRSGYKNLRMQTVRGALGCFIANGAIFLGAFAGFAYLLGLDFISRLYLIAYTVGTTFLLIVVRVASLHIARRARRKGFRLKNIIVVGTNRRAQHFLSLLARHPEWGYSVKGLIDRNDDYVGKTIAGFRVLGTLRDLPNLLEKHVIDEVYFISPRDWLNRLSDSIAYCEAVGVPAIVSTDLFDVEIAARVPKKIGDMTYLSYETPLFKPSALAFKRILDVCVAFSVLVLTSPLMLAIAVAIKTTSPGPVLFRQERCGMNGRRFKLLKFRTMVADAESKLEELKDKNEVSGPVFKMSDDPRITKVGRILRKTSLDEFPQFLNVLKGEISLVGPRPPLPEEVECYEPWQRRRLSINPGITCIWQVSGRNKIGFEEWMGLDLLYIDRWSPMVELGILFKTVKTVFAADGK